MNGGNFNLGMASLADTGQWLLVVEIHPTGISAILKNVDYEDTPVIPLFDRSWDEDETELLNNVETAVYDNPRMLEDFATRVIIKTDKALWIPADMTEDEEFDERLFTRVYPAASEDIGADFGSEEVCLYTLVPGLNAFLQRTLPGSRITSHLTLLKEAFERQANRNASRAIYVNARKGHVDIFAFLEGRFLCGTTHCWKESSDLVYKTLLVAHAYGFRPNETVLVLNCQDCDRELITEALEEFFPEICKIDITGKEDMLSTSFVSYLAAGNTFTIRDSK